VPTLDRSSSRGAIILPSFSAPVDMLTSSLRHYVRAARPAHFLRHSSTLAQLEESGSRILRVIKGRVQERVRLQGLVSTSTSLDRLATITSHCSFQLTETLSTPEDIANLRRLKETEPIQEAWDEWSTQREVRAFISYYRLASRLISEYYSSFSMKPLLSFRILTKPCALLP